MNNNFEETNKVIVPQNPDNVPYQERQYKRINGMKEQLEWIKRQLEYVNFSEKYKVRHACKKGEIYELDWGVNVNAEFSNRHYGLVIRDSSEYDPLVYVCPLKTNHKGGNPLSDIDLGIIPDLNSERKTLAVINQIRALDKMRIFSKETIGDGSVFRDKVPTLDERKMNLVLTAIYVFYFSSAKSEFERTGKSSEL